MVKRLKKLAANYLSKEVSKISNQNNDGYSQIQVSPIIKAENNEGFL